MKSGKKIREGFRALAFLIEESNRLDSNPHVGQLLPKREK
ncbi:hypothetical protein LCGC14_0380590 [marine sediment metagenome]|uniref:Uncharacterized protein n=1 Tax=marine sediment metagenome TaxID=412755 RepID=A0A0F9WBB2_9ZZZZ